MFRYSGGRARSIKRGRRIGRRRGLRLGSGLYSVNFEAILKIGGLVLVAAGIVCLAIFVVVPLFSGGNPSSVVTQSAGTEETATPTPSVDLTQIAEELSSIGRSSIIDASIYGDKIVFATSSSLTEITSTADAIAVYDMTNKTAETISGITKKYDAGLFEPKMNDKYIVYLDCKSKDGGSVCGYDISSGKQFVMRDYIFGKPKVTLSGKYALWLQQTMPGTDKLYLYDLETRECATIEIFVNTNFFISAPYISDDSIIYVQPKDEEKVLDGSSASSDAEICVMPLKDKGDREPVYGLTGTFIYEPMIRGNDIIYLDGVRDNDCRLLYSTIRPDAASASDHTKTLTTPVEIAKGVLNYCIGDGFAAYTKDNTVYVYNFADGSTRPLSGETIRALLAGAYGKDIIWYDITDGISDTPDVLMHTLLP